MNSCCRTGQMLTKETAEAGLPCTMPRTWGTLGKSFACRLAPSPWAATSELPQSHRWEGELVFGWISISQTTVQRGICPSKESCDCACSSVEVGFLLMAFSSLLQPGLLVPQARGEPARSGQRRAGPAKYRSPGGQRRHRYLVSAARTLLSPCK